MVRVRKNAEQLTQGERDRFLRAIATLDRNGRYQVYQRLHSVAAAEGHGGAAFLPWHRALLLRLERDLQAIDPSVTLPYWKFDEPAPALFSADFMGSNIVEQRRDSQGTPLVTPVLVTFSMTNPLYGWSSEGLPLRRSSRDRSVKPPAVQLDRVTTAPASYPRFRDMEDNPHGTAHVWVGHWMGSVPLAAKDPMFFLLHCNVDRLWARWQSRGLPAGKRYGMTGYDAGPDPIRVGHNPDDTMWPWNGVTGTNPPTSRPRSAPQGRFPQFGLAPPAMPRPRDMIDYLGWHNQSQGLGYCYDDCPYRR
jgi:tyrosinase